MQERIRLLILTSTLGRGGADKQILNLGYFLDPERFQVKIISMTPLGIMGEKGLEDGLDIESIDLKSKKMLIPGLLRIVRIVHSWNPDILLTFMVHAAFLGRLFKMLGLVKHHISSVRSTRMGNRFNETLFRWTNTLDDLTTVNSKKTSEHLLSRGMLQERKMRVIPNGIDAGSYAHKGHANLHARGSGGATPFTWIIVARIVEAKDYDTLLEAIARLSQSDLAFKMVSVGEGAWAERIKGKAETMGLNGYIRFLGARADIPELLHTADAFVLSSAWEGMPNVVMEAAAASLPIVSTDVGGVAELVHDGKSGFVVPAKDPEALALAMEKMMHLPAKRRLAMGQCGRDHMERNFSVPSVLELWTQTLLQVMETA